MTNEHRPIQQIPSVLAQAAAHRRCVSLVVDVRGRLIECDAAFAEAHGQTVDGVCGTPVAAWFDTLDTQLRDLWIALRTHARVTVDAALTRIDTLRFTGQATRFTHASGGDLITLCGELHDGDARPPSIEQTRLEFLMSQIDDGLFDWDIAADRVRVSGAAQQLFDLPKDEHICASALIASRIHPDELGEAQACMKRLLGGEASSLTLELRVVPTNGRVRWASVRARVVGRDATTGRVLRIVGRAVDVTGQRRFEESLRRERDLLDAVISTGVTALVVQDPSGGLIYANPEAARLLGTHRSRLMTLLRRPEAWRLARLDGSPCLAEEHPYRRVLVTGKPVAGALYRLATLDGGQLSLSINSAPTRDTDGRINRIVSTLEDITERLAAENTLRASERTLREVLERLPVAVGLVRGDGRITACNPAAASMFGVPVDRILGRNVFEASWPLVGEDGEPVVYPHHPLFSAWTTGQPVRDLTVVVRPRAETPPRWTLVNAVPRLGSGDRVLDVVVTLADITLRKQMELSLLQAQKVESIGRLAGGIAHDFNNLLTAVMGSAELLRMDIEPDHDGVEDLERIIDAAERGAALTSQLLAYARKQPIQPRVVDVSALVERAIAMLERLLGEDVRLHFTPRSGVRVSLDPGQFDQVLLNLAVNARDAMPGGGDLFIEVDDTTRLEGVEPLPESVAVLRVVDTGTGMPPELLDRIFDPFFTTKATGEGTGLGLAVCFGVAKQNGGVINVESQPGIGTTFEVVFPREVRRTEPSAAAASRPLPGGVGTVLVVEDDAGVRETARRALSRGGFTVITAADGERALLIIESGPPLDAVVTDVVMPALGGRVLADAVNDHHPDVPVLFTSGHADHLLGEHGVLREGVAFLAKPYSPETLCERVRSMLARPRGERR